MANYDITGSLLEACSCSAPCPCWIGEDPHGGKCDAFLAYRIDKGSIKGVDCGGVAFAIVALVPGNILKGNWKVAVYMSDKAQAAQKQAILDAWTGKLGGPVADLASLVGEVLGVEQVPITFDVQAGKGRLKIGQTIEAELSPFKGATGKETTLQDTVFTTIPGSPAYPGKASKYTVKEPRYGFNVDLHDHNAVQGSFAFEA